MISIDPRVNRARGLRRESPPAERLMWQSPCACKLAGWKFRLQEPLGPDVVDFRCFEARIVVEIDGESHGETRHLDGRRDAYLRDTGWNVLRFTNWDVYGNTQGVLERILEACECSRPSP
jgi:very-short-patch-repair endonuclease